MSKYLLDTNALSEVMRKRPNPGLVQRLGEIRSRDTFTSVVCVAELRYAAARVAQGNHLWKRIVDEVLSRIQILPLGEAEAERAGDLLAALEALGEPIGVEDVWISATALEHGLTVITRNLRHFGRIPGLDAESWWS